MKHKRKEISVEKKRAWNVRYKAIKIKKLERNRTRERKKMKQNAK